MVAVLCDSSLWLSVVYGLRLSDLNKETTLLYFTFYLQTIVKDMAVLKVLAVQGVRGVFSRSVLFFFHSFTYTLCLSVSCLCLWALLPDLNKMMMMMKSIHDSDHGALRHGQGGTSPPPENVLKCFCAANVV